MAKRVEEIILGVDVAQQWLDIHRADQQRDVHIDNTECAIEAYLAQLEGPAAIAIEPTNCFHERFVEAALRAGHTVYLVDPLRLSSYRQAVGQRAKTDLSDAALLARYLRRERQDLHPYRPLAPHQQRLWRLLKRRATLVQATTQLTQSLTEMGRLQRSVQAALRHLRHLTALIDKELTRLAQQLNLTPELRRLRPVPGIGPLNALALSAAFHRGRFKSADAFIAFLGLDVRVRDTGRFRGRRKLTKRGEPEMRRLLYNAAMAGCAMPLWRPYYQRLLRRGLSTTAALVALARKLARLAFALLRDHTEFDPSKLKTA